MDSERTQWKPQWGFGGPSSESHLFFSTSVLSQLLPCVLVQFFSMHAELSAESVHLFLLDEKISYSRRRKPLLLLVQ
jgi:hypothetical protein